MADTIARKDGVIVIIPANQKLTDLPEFASLRGRLSFDGRAWADVRGAANVSLPDGRHAVALPEENLAKLPSDPYGGNYSVGVHELGHMIQFLGVNNDERQQIGANHDARAAAGGPWTDSYGSSNPSEYFAQLTTAYFGRDEGKGQNGAAWVQANDPAMYTLLQQIYGPPEQL